MKRWVCVTLLIVALLLIQAAPSDAWREHWGGPHVFVGFGPAWWGPAPWWYYPPPYYAYSPPPVIVEQPPVYVQQSPPPPPPPQAQSYWYYCASAQAYYPTAQTCPEPWIKVPPRPE